MEGAIEIPENAQAEMQRGTIVAVNPEYHKDGELIQQRLSEGDRVVFKKYHADDFELDGKKYKIAHCEQIMTVID